MNLLVSEKPLAWLEHSCRDTHILEPMNDPRVDIRGGYEYGMRGYIC